MNWIVGIQKAIDYIEDNLKSEISADELFRDDAPTDNEAVSALMVLGYSKQEAESAVKGISGSTEEIIKQGLKNLMRG